MIPRELDEPLRCNALLRFLGGLILKQWITPVIQNFCVVSTFSSKTDLLTLEDPRGGLQNEVLAAEVSLNTQTTNTNTILHLCRSSKSLDSRARASNNIYQTSCEKSVV